MKHNKKRNTAFLYQILIKELTKATINENEERKKVVVSILKEFFGKGKTLKRELDLYNTLYKVRNLSEKDAEKLLDETKRVFLGLNNQHIFNAQTNLIKKINKSLEPRVFSNFVPNYRSMATISQVFNKEIAPKERVILERKVINHLLSSEKIQKKGELKLNNSVYKVFAKNFNSQYKNLYEEQKELLSKYVSSFHDNGLELKIYLNEEIARLKNSINNSQELKEIKEDSNMIEKTKKVLEVLDNFKGQHITEKTLEKIIKIQQLVREVEND